MLYVRDNKIITSHVQDKENHSRGHGEDSTES